MMRLKMSPLIIDWRESPRLKDTDFMEPTNRSESISANSDETSITIQITPDAINEGDETFKIVVTDINNAVSSAGLTTFEQIITITDDEMPTFSITNSTFEVAENIAGGNLVLDFELTGATQSQVTFVYTLSDDTAVKGVDFSDPTTTLSIPVGSTTTSLSIPITNDAINEGNEEFTFAITGLTGAVFADGTDSRSETITIIDDETPTISFAETSYEVAENVGMANIVVNLSNPSNRAIVIAYETIDMTAESPEDFTGVTSASNTTKTVPAGMISTTIQIPIISDNDNEGNEEFKVRISSLTSIGLGGGTLATEVIVKIIDDEDPILTLANTSFEIAENNVDGNFVVQFQLSGATGDRVTLDYTLTDGTAEKVQDYTVPTTMVEIAPGSTTATLSIPIIDDNENEGNQTFTLEISEISEAIASDKTNAITQVITIVDNEDPIISFVQSTIEIGESGGMIELDVNLSGATTDSVVITYETVDDTAASPGDFTGISSANPRNCNHWYWSNLDYPSNSDY